MSSNRVITCGSSLLAIALVLAACEDNGRTPRSSNLGTTSSSSSSSSSGDGGAGGMAGMGGNAGAAGAGGMLMPPAPFCGDYVIDENEECDDGNNEKGDGCAGDCLIESGESEPNESPAEASPFTTNQPPYYAKIDPEGDVDFVSFSVTTANTSVVAETLDVGDGACPKGEVDSFVEILATDGMTVLASDEDAGEGFCSRAVLPKADLGNYFVRIAASSKAAKALFIYRLRIDQIVNVCGDGTMTPSEACDDGNTVAGDGCSPTCTIEISESEPNDSVPQANAFSAPWNAVLLDMGDVDLVAVDVPISGMGLTATTTDQNTNACAAKTLDTVVEILAPDGMSVLAAGDDIVGNCGSALAQNLAAGKYYVRIKGGALATYPSPYGLRIIIQ